jgi:predicted nucleotidyltransferase
MVESQPRARIGLEYIDLMDKLAEMVGRPVDLTSKEILRNPYRKASIERDLTVLYAA